MLHHSGIDQLGYLHKSVEDEYQIAQLESIELFADLRTVMFALIVLVFLVKKLVRIFPD